MFLLVLKFATDFVILATRLKKNINARYAEQFKEQGQQPLGEKPLLILVWTRNQWLDTSLRKEVT